MDRFNSPLDGTGDDLQIGSSSQFKSPFLDIAGVSSSPVSEVPPTLNLEPTRNYTRSTTPPGPPPRVILCFIDRKGSGQTAHYSLVPLPPSYETAMDLAFEAFQAQFLESNVLSNFEIVLMIKCTIRLGDPSGAGSHSTTIWANIHPIDQWSSLVRDGDEILVCPKLPTIVNRPRRGPTSVSFAQSPDTAQAEAAGEPPLSEASSKIVICHKAHKSDTYKNETISFVQSFDRLKQSVHHTFGSARKSTKLKNWTTVHMSLYLNVTPVAMSGGLPRPNGHTTKRLLDDTTWPAQAYQVAKDANYFWEVEVVYEAKK